MPNNTVQASPLDTLLEGKSAEFKGRVLALTRRYNISESDPTFILLLGTNTLEVMLEKYPQEFEALFRQLMKAMEEHWRALQQEWAIAADKSTTAANNLTQATSLIKQAAETEQGVIKLQGEQQAKLLAQVYEEQRENRAKETERLIAQGTAIAHKQAAEHFQENLKSMRLRHYAEASAIACFGAAVLLFSGWAYGWHSRGVRQSQTYWTQVEQWNTDELKACFDAGKNTCNIHLEVPKELEN